MQARLSKKMKMATSYLTSAGNYIADNNLKKNRELQPDFRDGRTILITKLESRFLLDWRQVAKLFQEPELSEM
jgi:hypothetical protein